MIDRWMDLGNPGDPAAVGFRGNDEDHLAGAGPELAAA